MNRLGRFLSAPLQDRVGPQVDALVHRAAESALAGDRREAVADLRDLLAQEPGAGRALGAGGFPALLSLVGQEADLDQTLAECLALAVLPGGQESPAAVPAARQLAAAAGALSFLLHNLRPEAEFYTQYHSLQALRGLAFSCPGPVQEAVQGQAMGIGMVLDLMASDREVLRNEVLLLLARLLPGAPELAKLVAFEGAFERLFVIAREEGLGAPGGTPSLVAGDCLSLATAMVAGNPSTLRMLWEGGHLGPLLAMLPGPGLGPAALPLLRLVAAAAEPGVWMSGACRAPAPRPLPPPPSPGSDLRRQILGAAAASGWLPALLRLGLATDARTATAGVATDEPTRAQALVTLACLLADAPGLQATFAAVMEPGAAAALGQAPNTTGPALLAAAALSPGAVPPRVAAAADLALEAAAPTLDAVLAFRSSSTVVAAPYSGGGGSSSNVAFSNNHGGPGGALRDALSPDPSRPWDPAAAAAAAGVLANPLRRASPADRARLLRSAPELLPALAASLAAATRDAAGRGAWDTSAGIPCAALASGLRAALAWCRGCPAAATAFLAAAARAPFLMDAVSGRGAASDPLCRGLAALLLGVLGLEGGGHAPPPAVSGDDEDERGIAAIAGAHNTNDNAPAGSAGVAAQLLGVVRGPALGQERYEELVTGLCLTPAVAAASFAQLTIVMPGGVGNDDEAGMKEAVVFSPTWAAWLSDCGDSTVRGIFGGRSSSGGVGAATPPGPAMLALEPAPVEKALPLPKTNGSLLHEPGPHAIPAAGQVTGKPVTTTHQPLLQAPPAVPGTDASLPSTGQVHARHDAWSSNGTLASTSHVVPVSTLESSLDSGTSFDPTHQQLSEELQSARRAAAAAEEECAGLRGERKRLESELEGMAEAYASLDAHAADLQTRLDAAERQLVVGAAEHRRASQPESSSNNTAPCSPPLDQNDAEDDELTDLLVCLGQEEAKVAALSQRLLQLGVDPDDVIAAALPETSLPDPDLT